MTNTMSKPMFEVIEGNIDGNLALQNNTNINIVEMYLNTLNSEKTKVNYKTGVVQCFEYFYGVGSIYEITKEMIENISPLHAEQYVKWLKENSNKDNTASVRLHQIKSFYEYCLNKFVSNKARYKWLEGNPFATEKISVNDVKSHDAFTEEEIWNLIKVAKNEEDKVIYELAYRTGIRLGALLKLKMEDIKMYDEYWHIVGRDKGNKEFDVEISNEMYKKLQSVDSFSSLTGKDTIFYTRASQINKRLKTNIEKIGISEVERDRRNLTFHSIKKSSVTTAYDMTKDMKIAQEIGHHSDIRTSMNIYAKSKKKSGEWVGLKFGENDKKREKRILEGMSKEMLIEMLMER